MQILPIRMPVIKSGDDLVRVLIEHGKFSDSDILLISSKVIARTEGQAFDLGIIKPGVKATELARTCGQKPEFTELILQETKRLNGVIAGSCPLALLTSLKPDGMRRGRILCPNAGLDQSNIEPGHAIGWPVDPVKSAHLLRTGLKKRLNGPDLAVIVTDSCCRPARQGVVAFALVCDGIDPVKSEVGRRDLFGKPLRFTLEAVADQLATAANFVMGNAGQSVPAAIIRDHGLALGNFSGWVDGIDPDEDLFREAFL